MDDLLHELSRASRFMTRRPSRLPTAARFGAGIPLVA
jgi:hypothetical protein